MQHKQYEPKVSPGTGIPPRRGADLTGRELNGINPGASPGPRFRIALQGIYLDRLNEDRGGCGFDLVIIQVFSTFAFKLLQA